MLKYLVVASVYDPENDNSGITLTSEDFFNNYDAYILKIEANKITILGKDTDAVYYGITTQSGESLIHRKLWMDLNLSAGLLRLSKPELLQPVQRWYKH